MDADLIDRIYECSFVPELWPGVMDQLSEFTGALGGQLFTVRDRTVNWTGSKPLDETFQTYVRDGWFAKCNRGICVMNATKPQFFREHDFWSEDQLDDVPIYRDFFRPRGLGWSASTGMRMPTGDNIVLTIEREFDHGPVAKEHVKQLDELRPHLARSAFVSARLGLQRAKGASDTLTTLGLPALLIDESGIVIEANPLIEALAEHVHWRAQGKVGLTDKNANALLHTALATLDGGLDGAAHSFPVRDGEGCSALVAHVIPIRRSANDIFAHSYALLVLTPLEARAAPPVDLIRSLFDLTVSEARVARCLVKGESLEEIASSGAVAISTVRTQFSRVLEKTGCARQGEVVALLGNISVARQIDQD